MSSEEKGGSLTFEEIIAKIKKKSESKLKSKDIFFWEHKIDYDSSAEQLEPIYFWILDFMQKMGFPKVKKISDNFTASPGGGYFSELGQKATVMREQGMKMLQTVGVITKSLVNLIYDLKEFEIRLDMYKKLEDEKTKEEAILNLKQVWIDKVDVQKGNTSIKGMAMGQQFTFSTLIDAFMTAKSVKDVDKLDVGEAVRRILKPRLSEFQDWLTRSEAELTKRFNIERNYLKSQLESLKLYMRWAKPYLKASEQLGMKDEELMRPELVNAFNTLLLEVSLFGYGDLNIKGAVENDQLPKSLMQGDLFTGKKKYEKFRKYHPCIFIDFSFRGIPNKIPQGQGHYVFGGKSVVTFKAFTLNSDELKLFEKELEKQDIFESMKLIQGATEDSIQQIYDDVQHFLEDDKEKKEDKKKKENAKKEITLLNIKKDNGTEILLRHLAEKTAASSCFKLYNTYKKTHGMANFDDPEWEEVDWHGGEEHQGKLSPFG
ncbi:MAG: hypothetical protein ABH817_02210 [archaeon]